MSSSNNQTKPIHCCRQCVQFYLNLIIIKNVQTYYHIMHIYIYIRTVYSTCIYKERKSLIDACKTYVMIYLNNRAYCNIYQSLTTYHNVEYILWLFTTTYHNVQYILSSSSQFDNKKYEVNSNRLLTSFRPQ